jgi:hypothetical protein
MTACLDDLAQSGMYALDRVGRVNDPVDLRRKGKQWNAVCRCPSGSKAGRSCCGGRMECQGLARHDQNGLGALALTVIGNILWSGLARGMAWVMAFPHPRRV